jgi:anti-sigma factor RsiW
MSIFTDPERDQRLADALKLRRETQSPLTDDGLHGRIVRAARPALARRRQMPQPWWAWMAGWARVAVPVGLAASLAAGGLLVQEADVVGTAAVAESETPSESGVILAAATATPGDDSVADDLIAGNVEWLLTEAMSE